MSQKKNYRIARLTPEEEAERQGMLGQLARQRGSKYVKRESAGSVLLNRSKAPTDADFNALEKELKKSEGKSLQHLAEKYTKGYTRRLTDRQQVFLDQLLQGDTLIHAHEVAYPDQKSNYSTRSRDAWHISQHPLIIAAMERASRESENRKRMSASSIREFVIERLLLESQSAQSDAARVRSLELLGKIGEVAMFVDRKEVTTVNASPAEMRNLLSQKLREFFERHERISNLSQTRAIESNTSAVLRHDDDLSTPQEAVQQADDAVLVEDTDNTGTPATDDPDAS